MEAPMLWPWMKQGQGQIWEEGRVVTPPSAAIVTVSSWAQHSRNSLPEAGAFGPVGDIQRTGQEQTQGVGEPPTAIAVPGWSRCVGRGEAPEPCLPHSSYTLLLCRGLGYQRTVRDAQVSSSFRSSPSPPSQCPCCLGTDAGGGTHCCHCPCLMQMWGEPQSCSCSAAATGHMEQLHSVPGLARDSGNRRNGFLLPYLLPAYGKTPSVGVSKEQMQEGRNHPLPLLSTAKPSTLSSQTSAHQIPWGKRSSSRVPLSLHLLPAPLPVSPDDPEA